MRRTRRRHIAARTHQPARRDEDDGGEEQGQRPLQPRRGPQGGRAPRHGGRTGCRIPVILGRSDAV
jgi:hypothetical protein